MKFSVDEFCNKYGYNDIKEKYFSFFKITNVSQIPNTDQVLINIQNEKILPYKMYINLCEYLESFDIGKAKVVIKADNEFLSILEVSEYVKEFSRLHNNSVFNNPIVVVDNNSVELLYSDPEQMDNDAPFLDDLALFLYDVGFKRKLNPILKDTQELQHDLDNKSHHETRYYEDKHTYTQPFQKNFMRTPFSQYELLSLDKLTDPCNNVKIIGKIFQVENRVSKAGRLIQKLLVANDNYDAISATVIENKKQFIAKEMRENNVVGKNVALYGDLIFDIYSKTNTFQVRKEEFVSIDDGICDDYEKKRVELHAHTKYSEMDGVSSPEDIVKTAFKMGHRAVAITDHLNVQAFHEVFTTQKKIKKNNPDVDFKVLYGCEFNVVNQYLDIVKNPKDIDLKDETYVVFDLETTGLSTRYDSIIEFGACKMKRGNVIDEIDFFINPSIPLTKKITDLTGISNEDLNGALTFAECKDRILSFIEGCTLVAHNASFDFNFLNSELERINEPPLTNTVIDTLDLSKLLIKDRKRFRLGHIANYFKIEYNENDAHRANYDAKVLASVFNLLLKRLYEQGIDNIQKLYEYKEDDEFAKTRAYHAIALVRNQDGLRDLFKLVSISNTDTLAVFGSAKEKEPSEDTNINAEPRLFKETINQYRKNLLIGSACFNSELFEIASTRNEKELEKVIQFYDYIEIQPLENYKPKIEYKEDLERIKQILKDIIACANKYNKLIVATGDVHHVFSSEKQIRDIYINSKGIGNSRHPLYRSRKGDRYSQEIPNQRFLNTNEMLDAFSWLDNEWFRNSIVIDNTNAIADMCDEVLPFNDKMHSPDIDDAIKKARECNIDEMPFINDNRVIDANQYLKEIVYYNSKQRYGEDLDKTIKERIDQELKCIIDNGYGVIYYTCHLLNRRSNDDGYIVGSRGSVGSSLVAHFAGITEVNPLEPHYICKKCHHLEWVKEAESGFDLPTKKCPICGENMYGDGQNIPFATFLGINGDKIPDIDLNFSDDYQAKAHEFTREIFGEKNVYRAGTISKVQTKTAFGYLNNYQEEKLLPEFPRYKREALAIACSDVKRTTGKHPGGIVVVPNGLDIETITPLQYAANDKTNSWKTTHLEYHDFESNLLKFDILGHVDPRSMLMFEKLTGINVKDIPMNDEKVLSIFNSPKALNIVDSIYKEETGGCGIPEFGTAVARNKLEVTRPKLFSELVRINGLSHGTNVWENNAVNLITDQHLSLKQVICCRDDIMLYLISKGMDPTESFHIMEAVRKGKGLTKEQETVMLSHDVPSWYIDSCNKIEYMFPKAHAVAYTMMAYRVAYFKVYYPEYYYVSYFSLRSDAYEIETMIKDSKSILERIRFLQDLKASKKAKKKDKDILDVLEVCYEMNCRGYHLTNIDINKSLATEFRVNPDNHKEIIPPFTILDGLGDAVANKIVFERDKEPFMSKQEILDRTSIPKPLLLKLDKLGVLKGMDESNQTTLF